MSAKQRYLNTYRTVRAAAFIWYALAVVCFFKAMSSISSTGKEPSVIALCFWVGATVGLIMAARKSKKDKPVITEG